jgi:AraC-like DNA-binding protein
MSVTSLGREISITAVARAVGFRTPSHFTTVFRRSTGLTPSAYRSAVRHGAPAGGGAHE